jgi:hypothetical protein
MRKFNESLLIFLEIPAKLRSTPRARYNKARRASENNSTTERDANEARGVNQGFVATERDAT